MITAQVRAAPQQNNDCAANLPDCRKETEMSSRKLNILYSRLSRDDELQGPSNSIVNQQQLLQEYAERNGFTPYIHIQDDGFSGTNWDRPGWQEIISKIEADKVLTLITKDSSRMGRDYIRMGLYREMFREKGVRLIAVNDGIDTAHGDDDFTPFREILSEWYARDTSKKIRAIFKARASEGKHISPAVPYGYLRDREDKQKWIVDEAAAVIVRRIFNMVIEGYGVTQIARTLTEEKVPNPSAHSEMVGGEMRHRYTDPYIWRNTTIAVIIERREYLGHTINCKSYTDSYKSKKRKFTPKEELLIFENTHPAIISEEVWTNAQRLRRTIRRSPKGILPPCRLTGLLYCAQCGAKMTYRTSAPGHGEHNEYVCSKYRVGGGTRSGCTQHFISVPIIEKLILDSIRMVSGFVRENETEFIEKVREAYAIQQTNTVKDCRKQIAKAEKRQGELVLVVKKLLEANVTGRIPDSHFDKMFAEYADEQNSLEKQIAELKERILSYEADSVRADKFIELARRYTDFKELSTAMLNEFVERVLIHETDKSTGKRIRKVDVHLNFIGHFTVPVEEIPLAPEEIESERKDEERKAKRREITRRYRERKKAKALASAEHSADAI